MAKVNVNPNDFADLIMIFLFDKLMNNDAVLPKNERFREFIDVLKRKGVKAELLKYYLDTPVNLRTRYKMIKDAFIKPGSNNVINIIGGDKDDFEKEKKSKVKGVIRLVILAMKPSWIFDRILDFPWRKKVKIAGSV